MSDEEIRESARGMIISWLGEWALMLRADEAPMEFDRIVERHIAELLTVRGQLAEKWGYPAEPAPFPFPAAVLR